MASGLFSESMYFRYIENLKSTKEHTLNMSLLFRLLLGFNEGNSPEGIYLYLSLIFKMFVFNDSINSSILKNAYFGLDEPYRVT